MCIHVGTAGEEEKIKPNNQGLAVLVQSRYTADASFL